MLNEIECTKHKYREIRPLDLITPCKSFPSKNGSDMSIWIISFYYKTMIFKFKWKPCFNTNDFIELSKDLALLLFIFEEPLLIWNSQKDTEKNVLRIKVPTLNLTSIRQWNKMKQFQPCGWTSHEVGAKVFSKMCLWNSKHWRERANDLPYFSKILKSMK